MNQGRHKLLYILPKYDTNTDTHFAYLYTFLESLSEKLDVCVITERVHGEVQHKSVQDGFVLHLHTATLRVLEELVVILRAHRAEYRDIYVHYSFTGALAALVVTKLFGGRVFYWNCGMPWLYKRGPLREAVFRFILRNTILVTGANSLRNEYVKRYGLSITDTRVLPNWIDLAGVSRAEKSISRERLNIDQNKKVVLFVHHLSKRKGADMIAPVAKLLPGTVFVVVGDGPYMRQLKKETANEGNVFVIGRVANRDIGTYFSAADAFFVPSEEEGFPHVILESMAYGVPYVASDVGAVREISPEIEHKYIIERREPERFASALEQMFVDKIDTSALVEQAGKYSEANAVSSFMELFW